ncbi:MAG: redox-sensing transcriptional repressor Rex [Elusimicrobiota bacterium]|jgi:redox-sensing transcriptional repressor|nr:redox-sensing transcriptional repressor Rex [Elusimicrobiota bacterium]
MEKQQIAKPVMRRLPLYLDYLRSLLAQPNGPQHISATAISTALGLGEVQVRKDLGSISSLGKPKIGYLVSDLIRELENFLGYDNVNEAVLVGAGKLGKALLNYQGFEQYGLSIAAAFDIDPEAAGKNSDGNSILGLEKFPVVVKELGIRIGIITVPAQNAQNVCDLMIENDIAAIWNFANVILKGPSHILIHNENMAVSLAALSNHLKMYLDTDKKQ